MLQKPIPRVAPPEDASAPAAAATQEAETPSERPRRARKPVSRKKSADAPKARTAQDAITEKPEEATVEPAAEAPAEAPSTPAADQRAETPSDTAAQANGDDQRGGRKGKSTPPTRRKGRSDEPVVGMGDHVPDFLRRGFSPPADD